MPLRFGKYKDVPLTVVPSGYMWWLLDQGWLWPDVRETVLAELQRRADEAERGRRFREQQRHLQASSVGPDAATAEAIVQRGFRSLAVKSHPDVGGSHEGMIRFSASKQWLLDACRALPAVERR